MQSEKKDDWIPRDKMIVHSFSCKITGAVTCSSNIVIPWPWTSNWCVRCSRPVRTHGCIDPLLSCGAPLKKKHMPHVRSHDGIFLKIWQLNFFLFRSTFFRIHWVYETGQNCRGVPYTPMTIVVHPLTTGVVGLILQGMRIITYYYHSYSIDDMSYIHFGHPTAPPRSSNLHGGRSESLDCCCHARHGTVEELPAGGAEVHG